MEKYFEGTQPHINIEKIEAEIALLPGPPERALEIAKVFSSYLSLTALCAALPFTTILSYFRTWQVITSPSIASPLFLHTGIETTYSTLPSFINFSTIS